MKDKLIQYHRGAFLHMTLLLVCLVIILPVNSYGATNPSCLSDEKPYMVREFDVEGHGTFKAFTVSGDIEIQSVADTKRVRVELYLERGYSMWTGNKNLDNYRIKIFRKGNDVIASVESKSRDPGFFSDRMRFSYKVYLPVSMSTELKTLGGDIQVNGLSGNHMAKTGGGNVSFHNMEGRVGAYTSGGDIKIERSAGTIFAHANGGNVNIANTEGELRIRTVAGNINSRHISGSFIADAQSGDIKVQFSEVGEGISLKTSAGNIYAEIPSGNGYNLFAVASEIELDTALDFRGDRSDRKVDGTVNDGGTPVQLQTSLGRITLKTN